MAAQATQRESLPFDAVRDFAEARRGFLAAPESRQIMAEVIIELADGKPDFNHVIDPQLRLSVALARQ